MATTGRLLCYLELGFKTPLTTEVASVHIVTSQSLPGRLPQVDPSFEKLVRRT